MHELSLSAYLPHQSVDHVLRVLAAITGMPPSHVLEHHLLFKPKRLRPAGVTTAAPGGGSVPGGSAVPVADFYYLKLVADVRDEEERLRNRKDTASESQEEYDVQKQNWTIRFSDLPEVSGKRPVTSRLVLNAEVGDGDALAFVDNLGYTLLTESLITGHFFIHHSIQITVTRILLPPALFTPFPLSNATPLDPANAFMVQAFIKIASSNEQESMNRGIEELKQFKAEMKGVIDLEISDRLSLDTRVR